MLMKRLLSMVLAASLLLAALPVSYSDAAEAFSEVGGWNETIYAEISGISDSDVTGVSYSGPVSGKLDGEDLEFLVRNTVNGVRIDILGLPAGSYDLTVETGSGTVAQKGIEVPAQDRSGFAHFNYTEGVGAYNDDGTLKDNAIVLYVTDSNKDTVTLTAPDGTTVTGIGHILNSSGMDVGTGKNGNGGLANSNAGILNKLAAANIPLVVRLIGNVTAPEGITAPRSVNYGGATDSNGFMARLQNCKNITIEGVGGDAAVDGWGLSLESKTGDYAAGYGRNFEIRNLSFRNVPEDCIGIEGKQTESVLTGPIERCWVHNCAFYYASSDAVEKYGVPDGAVDFKRGQYYTMSYCYFEGYQLTNLIGASDADLQYHVTWHHNYWYDCYSRSPLARQADMHLYNNVFEGQDSYCMSLRADTYIFSEYNTYINSNRVSDNMGGGVCKSYNNTFTKCTGQDNSDIVTVTDRNTAITSNNPYANFEMETSSYVASGDYLLQTSSAEVVDTVRIQSGVMSLGSVTLPESGSSSGGSFDPDATNPTEPTEPSEPSVDDSAYIHNFTFNGLYSDFYTFTSCNLANYKGIVEYNGLIMDTCLKMESATNVTFNAHADGELLLVFHEIGYKDVVAAGKTVKLNGAAYTVGEDNAVTIPVIAGENTLTRGDAQIFLYYMEYIPEAETPLFDLAGANMALGNSLSMNLYVNASDVAEGDYYMEIVKTYADGRADAVKSVPMSRWGSYSGMYYVTFDGVAAKEMTDNFYVTVYHADGTQASNTKVISIADYAISMLNRTDAASAASHNLMADMLNYGAAAQQSMKYAQNDLANANMTAEHKACATQNFSMDQFSNNTVKGTGFMGGNLTLVSNICMNVYFDAELVDNTMSARVSYTDHNNKKVSYEIPGSEFFVLAGYGFIGVEITTMAAADAESMVTVEILDGGKVVASGSTSVESVAFNGYAGVPLYVDLMKFCTAAYNFFH